MEQKKLSEGKASPLLFAEAHHRERKVPADPLESQFFPAPEDLIKKTSWVHGSIGFVHPLTSELVTLYPRKGRCA